MKFSPTGVIGEYDVFDDDGAYLGLVRKKVERYNIRPPITVIEWVPTAMGGARLSSCRTRALAADALKAEKIAH